jgi:hypothetical protein
MNRQRRGEKTFFLNVPVNAFQNWQQKLTYGFPTSSCGCWIPALYHKVSNYAMKDCIVIISSVSQCGKIVTGSRGMSMVELNHKASNTGIKFNMRPWVKVALFLDR